MKILKIGVGFVLLCLLAFGAAEFLQEAIIGARMPMTLAEEMMNRSFSFMLGILVAALINHLARLSEKRKEQTPA